MHVNERWLRKKTARKEAAAKTTGWNTYSIHDYNALDKRLVVQHQAKKAVATKLGQPIPTGRDLFAALTQNDVRRLRFIGATSKYMPHQGKHECARRLRQAMSPWRRQQLGL